MQRISPKGYEWTELPQYGYGFQGYDPVVHVRASGREVNVSPKAAREVALAIKGMAVSKAIDLLESVQKKDLPIAFRRHKLKVGHRSELVGFPTGSYPVKVARAFVGLLKNLQSVCEFRGLDPERVTIIHSSAYAGRTVKDYTPRAMGRSSPNFHVMTHIELVGKEV